MDRHGFRIIPRTEGLRTDLARLTDGAERLYWRLTLACDQHGCHRAEINTILGSVLVGTKATAKVAERSMGELVANGIISVWDAEDGARWLEIIGFDETQTENFIQYRGRRLAPPNPNPEPTLLTTVVVPKAVVSVDDKWDDTTRGAVAAVFEHWVAGEARTGGAAKAILTDKRKALIKKRLDDGYTVDDLKMCVDGYHSSPWHIGQNNRSTRYTSLDLCLRDAEKVEAGMNRVKKGRSDGDRFKKYDA